MSDDLQQSLMNASQRLCKHLEQQLDATRGYPDAPTWGYAFTALAAIQALQSQDAGFFKRSLMCLEQQPKDGKDFPWEFVVYALARLRSSAEARSLGESIGLREKGTRMFNWFLLRRVNRSFSEKPGIMEQLKLRIGLALFQRADGLIVDEFKTRSLQYHAFCLFLLCDLREQYGSRRWLDKRIERAARLSANAILNDGTALYLGRGQEQIFGYGSLLYALTYCHLRITRLDKAILQKLSGRILAFQREDGSFPLVLRSRNPEAPNTDFGERPSGWYGYNTLYDYQPFLAYTLARTAELYA